MSRKNAATAPKQRNIIFRLLGPGLVTGAADDDPSGIATYSQAGAQFGYGLLWTVFLTTPFMEGEANLRGHLRSEGSNSQEENGSSSYVSPEKNKDTQLQYALELVRGIRSVDTDAIQQ